MKKLCLILMMAVSAGDAGLLGSGVQGISNTASSSGSSGGSGTPGGSNTQVQFNDGGAFGGDAGLVFTKTNGNLGIGTTAPTGRLEVGSGGSAYLRIDPATQSYLMGDMSLSGTGTFFTIDDSAGTETHYSQGFTPLTINGGFLGINNNNPAEAFSVYTASAVPEAVAFFNDDESVQFGDLNCSGHCTQWEINAQGAQVNVLASNGLSLSQGTGNFILKAPSLANDLTWTLPTSSGTSGQFLSTNGSGTLSWATGGGAPGGSTTQVQYNSAGAFAGSSSFVFDGTNVGIGSSSPASRLDVAVTRTTSNSSYSFIKHTLTDSGSNTNTFNKYGINLASSYSGNFTASGASGFINGAYVEPTYSGTINSSGDSNDINMYGIRSTPIFTGTIGDPSDSVILHGYESTLNSNLGTTGTTVKYGVYLALSGTADVNYAAFLSASGATTNYNVYANGSAFNYFGGNVGIGVTSPASQLHTSGTVRFANFGAGTATFDASGNISSVSDERLKDIKGEFKASMDAISKIKPILYKWNKKSGLEMESIYAGFSAQNVQKALPEAVGKNKDGILSLQDRALLAATVNAIKELDSRLSVIEKMLNIKK